MSLVCPDEGTCHHECGHGPCFRVLSCEPLSGVFPGDRWPSYVVDENYPAWEGHTVEAVLVDLIDLPPGLRRVATVTLTRDEVEAKYPMRWAHDDMGTPTNG